MSFQEIVQHWFFFNLLIFGLVKPFINVMAYSQHNLLALGYLPNSTSRKQLKFYTTMLSPDDST